MIPTLENTKKITRPGVHGLAIRRCKHLETSDFFDSLVRLLNFLCLWGYVLAIPCSLTPSTLRATHHANTPPPTDHTTRTPHTPHTPNGSPREDAFPSSLLEKTTHRDANPATTAATKKRHKLRATTPYGVIGFRRHEDWDRPISAAATSVRYCRQGLIDKKTQPKPSPLLHICLSAAAARSR